MNRTFLALALLPAAAGGLAGCHRASGDADSEPKPVAAVQVAALEHKAISRALPAIGVIEAASAGAHVATLGYDVQVGEIEAPVGTRVDAGAAIVTVEPTPDAKLQAESAKGVAILAEKSLKAVQQRYDLKLATGDDLRTAQQAALDAKLKAESYARRGMGAPTTIKAQNAAIVVKLDAQPGAVIPAGTAIATWSDAGHLQARLSVETADIAQIHSGQPVTLTSVGRPDGDPVTATVTAVGGVADAASGSVDVRVSLPDSASGWIAGERVQGAIELEKKEALVAPRSAVLPDDDKQILYTVKDHKAVKHEVQLGIQSADAVEVIAKDLQPGDQVVTQGNYELADGMAVRLPGETPKDDDDKKAGDAAKADETKAKGGAENSSDSKKTGDAAAAGDGANQAKGDKP